MHEANEVSFSGTLSLVELACLPFDKKNRRIEARETTRACDFGSLSNRH
jgi:hypothetical protein